MGRKQSGKGMVICIDKMTAVRMYDKVQKYWKAYPWWAEGSVVRSRRTGSPRVAEAD